MGSCYSKTITSTVIAVSSRDIHKRQQHQHQQQQQHDIRPGVDGLLDYGFEFRLHQPCPKHKPLLCVLSSSSSTTIDEGSYSRQNEKDKTITTTATTTTTTTTTAATTTTGIQQQQQLLHLRCTECSIPLYRMTDDALITTDNRKTYIPPKIYTYVAALVQQTVSTWLQRDYNMYQLPLFTTTTTTTTTTSTKKGKKTKTNNNYDDDDDDGVVVVHALVSQPPPPPPTTTTTGLSDSTTDGTLLIINGRGMARAGILSTRHTIESGIEKGSAVYHIHRALLLSLLHNNNNDDNNNSENDTTTNINNNINNSQQHQQHSNTNSIQTQLAVVCLDSNALGSYNGSDTVHRSLSSPALAPYLSNNRPLYVLCHSAAGGYFVQHLLKTDAFTNTDHKNNPTSSSTTTAAAAAATTTATATTTTTAAATTTTVAAESQSPTPTPLFTVEQIKALVFTDSTHDLRWLSLQSNPKMTNFLQSSVCLYICSKNNDNNNNNSKYSNNNNNSCSRSSSDDKICYRSNDSNSNSNNENHYDCYQNRQRLAVAVAASEHLFSSSNGKYNNNNNKNNNVQWKKRFGNIETVYAGTNDHSLMCYQARFIIWNFINSKRQKKNQQTNHNDTITS